MEWWIQLLYIIGVLLLLKLYGKWATGWCKTINLMSGKVVIITGANTGIGFETALELAKRNAIVVVAARNETKGNAAVEEIIKRTENFNVVYKKLDLCSFASIRQFVNDIKASYDKVDILINNAGAAGYANKKTEDGIIQEMQTNHFGPFLLTNLLIPMLKKAPQGRIITVSSVGHLLGSLDFDKVNKELTTSFYWCVFRVYACGKLCNLLFSNELSRRLQGTKITSNSLHPGHVRTGIYSNLSAAMTKFLVPICLWTFFKNPVEGCQTMVYLAVSKEGGEVTGKYFVDCERSWMKPAARDENLAKKLWEYSEDLVGLAPEEQIGQYLKAKFDVRGKKVLVEKKIYVKPFSVI